MPKHNVIATKIQGRDKPNDVFYTPQTLVDIHLNRILPFLRPGDKVLDPFYGAGAYFKSYDTAFRSIDGLTFDFTEIAMGRDFYEYSDSVDVIVSNPPFSDFKNVLKKCVELNPHTISLVFGIINMIPNRIAYMNSHGYWLVDVYLTKVKSWFASSALLTFTRNGPKKNIIDFDILTHVSPGRSPPPHR